MAREWVPSPRSAWQVLLIQRWDSNTSEKIQRYMGYLLKSGKEDGIYTDAQGSAPLSQVAKVLEEKMPRPVGR